MAPCLILIGFMGSGKSSVGELLAGRLGWNFFDADLMVEREQGMTVSEIFEQMGEQGFRQAEEVVVTGLLEQAVDAVDGTVVSLGGGAVLSQKVYERLLNEPLVVFLEEELDTAFERSQNGKRPLAGDRQDFKKLFDERKSLYRGVARFSVDVRGKDVNEVVDEVVRLVKNRTGMP